MKQTSKTDGRKAAGRMIDGDAPLGHHLLEITQTRLGNLCVVKILGMARLGKEEPAFGQQARVLHRAGGA